MPSQNNNSALLTLSGDLGTPLRVVQGSALMLSLTSDKLFTSQAAAWTFTPDSGIGQILFGSKGELTVSAPDAASSPLTVNGNTSSFVMAQSGAITLLGGTPTISAGTGSNIAIVDGSSGKVQAGNGTGVILDGPNKKITINASQVLAGRITGWADPTGTLSRATFISDSVTLPVLAAHVAQMTLDLKTHGLFGT